MGKVLIIGAGGVGTVVAHKIAQNPDVFTEIVLVSRTQSKCDAIADAIGGNRIVTDRVDADKVEDLVSLFKKHKPDNKYFSHFISLFFLFVIHFHTQKRCSTQTLFSSSKKTTHSPLSVSDVRSSTSLSPLLSKYCFLNGDAVISL